MKKNWIIVWHDRHCDDKYYVVLNATLAEAEAVEFDVAKKAGWDQHTEEVLKYGYGDYGYGEDYCINLQELESSNITILDK